ncbi:MAG: 30S ribosomal protein S11 [Candidatus Jacksonbacteria bacterium]|nr:30S ribosomal protein S11 [Candidatus Jacksonbacteria bacterium]
MQLTKGNIYIQATYNNTMVSIADQQGNVVAQCSAGGCGFKGPKKATPFAASIVVRTIIGKIADSGLSEVDVFVKGVGQGRESAIRSFAAQGYKINVIKDVTPMPHNGPRQRKPRRV